MLIKNKIITPQIIDLIKDTAAPVIELDNTKGQDPNIIKNIPQNIDLKVLGGYNFFNDIKYLKPKYTERTYYSAKVLASAIEKMQKIENKIDPHWTDLTKALFVFNELTNNIQYDYTSKLPYELRNLTSLVTGFSRCAGFAICFKEIMDRLNIKNEFRNIEGIHSCNILFYKDQPFIVDVTFARDAINHGHDDYYKYFGAFNPHKTEVAHIPARDKYTNYHIFKPQTIKKALDYINLTQNDNNILKK